jgi:hypothetical protein
MPDTIRREAPITDRDVDARTLTVQLLAWDDPRTVADPGRPAYVERWARDSLTPRDRLYVLERHGGELIGRMDPPDDDGAGPTARVHIARTAAGNDLLAGVIESVSIEALADPAGEVWNTGRTEVTRTRAELCGVAFTFQPAHNAPILARQENPMDTDQPTTTPDTPPATVATLPPAASSADAYAAETVELRREMATLSARLPAAAARARFENLGELMHASSRDLARELPRDPMGSGVAIHRALLDVTSADVPGIMPPQQIRELYDVIDGSQPLVDAAGTAPAPTRLSYEYPHVTQRPSVAPQTGEKVEIVSRETKIITATAPVQTLAGGEDTSIQVIQLSDPSYLQIQGQLYAEEMARATDVAAYNAYTAVAGHNVSIGLTVAGWVPALFDLAAAILSTSRRFPDRLILSTDLWANLGGAVDSEGRPIFTSSNAVNPAGSASLRSPDGDVRELHYTVDPNLPLDRGLMFASSAFRAGLGPVQTMTADVPAKLGRDYAMFRFGAFLAVDPAGMAEFATGAAPTAAATRGGKGK